MQPDYGFITSRNMQLIAVNKTELCLTAVYWTSIVKLPLTLNYRKSMLSYWLLPPCLPCFLKCSSPHTSFPVHDIPSIAQLNKRRISWKKNMTAKSVYWFFPSNRFRKQTTRLTELFAIANVVTPSQRKKKCENILICIHCLRVQSANRVTFQNFSLTTSTQSTSI
jgi:hypothetical protein